MAILTSALSFLHSRHGEFKLNPLSSERIICGTAFAKQMGRSSIESIQDQGELI